MSFVIAAAVGVGFIAAEPKGVCHYAFLVAAAAHTIGLFRVRKEGPEDDSLL